MVADLEKGSRVQTGSCQEEAGLGEAEQRGRLEHPEGREGECQVMGRGLMGVFRIQFN